MGRRIKAKNSLIQIVFDNFDVLIHFQNGLKQTHGMATVISQSSKVNQNCTEEQFKNIKLHVIKSPYFKCCKKPPMFKEFCSFNVLPLMLYLTASASSASARGKLQILQMLP